MKTFFLVVCLSVATLTQAQKYSTSNGWTHDYLFNPALTGEHSNRISLDHSARFPRFNGSPYLTTFNAEGCVGAATGIGFTANHYRIGPLTSLGFQLKASKKLNIQTGYLRIGAAAEVANKDTSSANSKIWPNAQVGISYHTERLTLGIAYQKYYESFSAPELYFETYEKNMLSAQASYKFTPTDSWIIIPQARMFARANSTLFYQLRTVATVKQKFQFGMGGTLIGSSHFGFTNIEAFAGISIFPQLQLNYATSFSTNSAFKGYIHSVGLVFDID